MALEFRVARIESDIERLRFELTNIKERQKSDAEELRMRRSKRLDFWLYVISGIWIFLWALIIVASILKSH